jgi:hypothetical protein
MAHYWKALILTESNVLQNVEFETPGSWRQDAIAQVKSMYGAKEVRFCNPISKSSSVSSNQSGSSSSDSDATWAGLLVVLVLIAIWAFRYIILAAVVFGGIYLLYKWLKK